MECFSAIAAFAAAVSAIVSLYQVVHSIKAEAKIRQINNDTLWYNRIVLDTIITQLNDIIDEIERDINSCGRYNKDCLIDKLGEVNQKLNADINSLNEVFFLLKIFDNELFVNCSKKLEEIRDIYSNAINRSLKSKQIAFYYVKDVHMKKKEIVEHLLKYAQNMTK